MNVDMATLTGAYAVDALAGRELAEFERHLSGCADCAQEVDELRETAARLGADVATTPSEDLKRRVLDEVARTRQHPPRDQQHTRPDVFSVDKRRWGSRLAIAAAALGVALAGVFGGMAWQSQQELADVNNLIQRYGDRGSEITRILQAPDARIAHDSAGNAQAATVVSRARGEAMFLGSNLSAPPPDRAYQLWFVGDTGATSAGMLRQDAGRDTSRLATIPGGARQMAITLEPSGGSPQPTTEPIMTMTVPG